jgi:hypothetical protein
MNQGVRDGGLGDSLDWDVMFCPHLCSRMQETEAPRLKTRNSIKETEKEKERRETHSISPNIAEQSTGCIASYAQLLSGLRAIPNCPPNQLYMFF